MEKIIYSGIVVSTKDPEGLSRVQVKFPGFEEDIELPWVRMLLPHASENFGEVLLPEVGDEVILLKGFKDSVDHMYLMGSVYNGNRKPNYADDDGKNNIKEFTTRTGHTLQYDDTDGAEKITLHTPEQDLMLEMDHAGTTINLTAQGNADSGTINIIVASGTVNVECDAAKVTAQTSVDVTAGQTVTINGDSSVEITGATSVKVGSDTQVDVEAPMINIKGDMVAIG